MRPKVIILQQINELPTNNFHQSQNLTIAIRVLTEVMVDIRDILNDIRVAAEASKIDVLKED